jgi:hypothetical protein
MLQPIQRLTNQPIPLITVRYVEDGTLTHLHVAFSRDDADPKCYVQDKVAEHGAAVSCPRSLPSSSSRCLSMLHSVRACMRVCVCVCVQETGKGGEGECARGFFCTCHLSIGAI